MKRLCRIHVSSAEQMGPRDWRVKHTVRRVDFDRATERLRASPHRVYGIVSDASLHFRMRGRKRSTGRAWETLITISDLGAG
jgi:hypothetical protein